MSMLHNTDNLFHDAKLPHLGLATNPVAMAQVFAENFRPLLAESGWDVEKCAIEWLQHRRGGRCRLLYRLTLRDLAGRKTDQWFFGKLLREGKARPMYEEALRSAILQNGFWPPVNFWPELEMVVWTFPNDPDMPHLVRAVNTNLIRAQLNANLPAWGLSERWRCEQVEFERVKYMPGKRCVLRYNARLADPSGENRRLEFFSKTYSDGKSRLHHQVLQNIYDRLGRVLNVPRPLKYVEDANTFWQEPWDGRPLIDSLDDWNWEELFPRLAETLAVLHKSRGDGFPPSNTLERAYEAAREDAQTLEWLLPEYGSRFREALAALAAAKKILAAQPVPPAPIHGTMRIEQFLVRDREIALVDFDAAALGDPLYDLAEFVSSLQYLAFSRGLAADRLTKAAEFFQTQYAKQVPWPCEARRVAWYVVVSLLNKMHETVRSLDSDVVRQLDGILQIMDRWSADIVA